MYGPPTSTFGATFPGFLGGESGVFRATGGDVPAFERPVDFPILPLLEAPTGPEGKITVARGQALALTWSRGTADMIISVRPERPNDAGDTFECLFDAALGQGSLPSEVVDLVAPGEKLSLWGLNRAEVEAGQFSITLLAGSAVRTPDKAHMVEITVP
jgi:hypothetical protein